MITTERVKYIEYKGKKILFIDFENLDPLNLTEFYQTIETAKKFISSNPYNSVYTLTNIKNYTNFEIKEAMKEYTAHNKPYVKAGAVLGIDGLKKVIYQAVVKFSGRNLALFNNIEDAKEWLASQ